MELFQKNPNKFKFLHAKHSISIDSLIPFNSEKLQEKDFKNGTNNLLEEFSKICEHFASSSSFPGIPEEAAPYKC